MKYKRIMAVLSLILIMAFIAGRSGGSGRKALQAENNDYFTQELYDNLKEMRFYFGGSEPAEVIDDEEHMYDIFNFLAGLTQCDTGNEELLWGFSIFEFEMKNGDVHTYTQSGRDMSHCLNYVPVTMENYEEAGSINEERTEIFYVDHGITEELNALVRGTEK